MRPKSRVPLGDQRDNKLESATSGDSQGSPVKPASGPTSSPEEVSPGQGQTCPPQAQGLIVRGQVIRRTRRVVGDGKVVVTYTLGPRYVTVEQWNPSGEPFQRGEMIELEVTPNVWNGRVTFQVARREEDF